MNKENLEICRSVSGRTRILGIFGDPVEHSLSPAMQNAALAAAGIDAIYVPFHVVPEQLSSAVNALRGLNIWGVNVTVPHKEEVCRFLDDLDPVAEVIGAVNTIVNRQGRLVGYNTDAEGLIVSLREDLRVSVPGKRVQLLGAGGACRAAAFALAHEGAAWIGIANRSVQRAIDLAGTYRQRFPGTSFAAMELPGDALASFSDQVDLFINTSVVGLRGDDFEEFPWQKVNSSACFYDMVYRAGITPWLQTAAGNGHQVADGLGMLAAQGEAAFALWTGQPPPSGVMKRRLLSACDGI